MKLIVGLGNPGEKYIHTRHNIGFMTLEQFFKDVASSEKTVWGESTRFKSEMAVIEWQPKHGNREKVVLVKPNTYMNNSGMAVSLLVSYYRLRLDDIWILHDEIDLPVGSLRIRVGGSAAGHRGIASIIEHLGTEKFWRFRIGIGRPHQGAARKDVDDHVLGIFGHDEKGKIREALKHTSKAVAMALEESLEASMNKFNTK